MPEALPAQPSHHGPSWLLVIIVSILVSGLILALFVIAALWSWVNTSFAGEKESADVTGSSISVETADWETAEPLDLDSQEEGNDALLEEEQTTIDIEDTSADDAVSDESAEDTTDWPELNSRTLSVRFRYPTGWTIWEGTTPLSDYIQIGDYISTPEDAFLTTIPGHKLEVAVTEKTAELSLEEWITQIDEEYAGQVGVLEDTLIDGFPTKLDYLVTGYSTAATAFIPLGDGTQRVVVITLYGPETTAEELQPLFTSILSTFKIKS